MSTAKPLPFQPAPRPQPRTSPEQARELAEATRDLGFSRTTSPPDVEAPAEVAPVAPAATPIIAPRLPRSAPAKATASEPKRATEPATEKMATLKVSMDDETWDALRFAALKRHVTVKYLVMEALAEKGYDIDLSKVAEDGRRLR